MMMILMFMFFSIVLMFLLNKKIKMMFSNLMMLCSLLMLMKFNYSMDWQMIYGILGVDFLGMLMMLLSFWILGMMIMILFNNLSFMINLILMILLISLILCFSSMNYLIFYLFFEISLIPTFYLILGYGYQPERMNAGIYMLMYTLFASLPLFILIFYLYNEFNSLSYLFLMNSSISNLLMNNELLYMYLILAFIVKLPLFMFHYWLPKAHVEAPVVGSMILAGVMLKLGGYGIIRFLMLMMNLSIKYNFLYFSISLIGMIHLSIVCLRQNDMKLLVAYSSVVHMGMMLMGLLTMTKLGFSGGIIMMLGHGLCSSAMFMGVNMIYERTMSRNMYLSKGFMYLFPSFSMWWFMLCVSNMSSPPTLNLLSELMLVCSSMNWSFNIMILLMMGMYLSACYSLYLYSYSQHGSVNSLLVKMKLISMNEYMNMMFHWLPLNLMILKMWIFF